MSVEKLKRQDIAAETQEDLKNLKDPKAVTFPESEKATTEKGQSFLERKEDSPGTRELKKKVNEILKIPETFTNKAPRVECFHEIIGKETLNTIKQKDPINKGKISRELACLSSIESDHPELKSLINVCNRGMQITPKNCGLKENDWAGLQDLFDTAQEILKEKIHKLFLLFGGTTENMPDITSLATGDGTRTRGIKGRQNIGRIFFDYPNLKDSDGEKFKMSQNYFNFSDANKKAEILIGATGFNAVGGNIKIEFKKPMPSEEIHVVSRNYNESGLVYDEKSDPPEINGVKVSITETGEGPKVIIPEDFNKRGIEIKTESNQSEDGSDYDEINFIIISDNGYITGNPIVASPFGNGEFNLTPDATHSFEEKAEEIDWADQRKKPHKLEITNNSKGYYFSPETAAEQKYNAQKKEGDKIKNEILQMLGDGDGQSKFTKLIEGLEKEIDEKINRTTRYDKDDQERQMTPANKKIQRQLALNRFLTSFQILLKNENFKKNFLEVENLINLKFRVEPKHTGISIQ